MELSEEKLAPEPEESFSDITFLAPMEINAETSSELSEARISRLLTEIRNNLWGCDLILCLFMAALQSYRSDKCLRPFPPMFINNDDKNFSELKSICDSIPPLKNIINDPKKCSSTVYRFLVWLFLDRGYPIIKRVAPSSVQYPGTFTSVFKAHYVYEVCYNEKAETLWQQRKGCRDIIMAYHGSSIDNFYSILKSGLQQHFSLDKPVLFGSGIYLSSELSVSAHYAPFGQTWKNSCNGNKHSIIAICEIINDIDKVKCKDSSNKKRSTNEGRFVGDIPEKYFVVTDSDMVRVKYLMVYKEKANFSVKSYIAKNMFLFSLLLYFIFLIFMGIFTNSSSMKALKRYTRRFFND